MARKREFDEKKVMEVATNLFWRKGYHAVSTEDLKTACGISRSSMYGAYKDKRSLFILALNHYRQVSSEAMIDTIKRASSVKEAIAEILDQLVNDTFCDTENKGCFMVNTAIELAPHDKEISAIVEANKKNIIDALKLSIEQGIKSGELKLSQKPEALALFFYNLVNGLRVDGKISNDRTSCKEVVEIAKGVFNN